MIGWIFAGVVVVLAIALLRHQKAVSQRRINELRRKGSAGLPAASQSKESELDLLAAVEELRHGVLLLSSDNKFLILNSAASYLLNLGDEVQWKGRSLIDLIRFPEINVAINAVKVGDRVQKVSVEVPIDGGVRSVKVRVTKIETAETVRVLVALQDETDAMLLDQMRREFVANTSHELKTPLAAIKGYAETVELAIEDDPDAAQHFMRQINVECQRLERLIEDMMQLARAQSGKSSLTISSVRLDDVIEQSLSSNRPIAKAKSIELTRDQEFGEGRFGERTIGDAKPGNDQIDSALLAKLQDASVRADPEAALTIINNLISNAVRYTPNGGKVTVGIRDADRFFAIYVDDTGVGISAAEQKRVFERFYRTKGKRQYDESSDEHGLSSDRGTGIGLSIVKQLTKALGGEVRLSSEPGVGSRFEVLLPKA